MTMAWGVSQGIDDIVERLERNDGSLQSLYLMRHRRFNEEDVRLLSDALSRNSTLVELNLSSHSIDTSMAKILADGLQKNTSIKYISIGNSSFGDDAMMELCACLSGKSAIETLDIERKGITERSASSLCSAIRESRSVKHVIVSNNTLNQGLLDFSPCIPGLESIALHDCGLHHQVASEAVAKGLMEATSLASLELDGNSLEYRNAQIISTGLKSCSSLERLSLNDNPLGVRGVNAISYALPQSLRRLDLGSTKASNDGIKSIIEMISQGRLPNLTYLNICGCDVDGQAIAGIMDAVSESRISLSLDAGGNPLGTSETQSLFESLIRCKTLESLRLHGCGIGGVGARTLAQSVNTSENEEHHLKDLDISGNGIDEASMLEFLHKLPDIVSSTFTNMTSLIIAANPDVQGERISEVVESLASHDATHRVVIMRAASDSNQHG